MGRNALLAPLTDFFVRHFTEGSARTLKAKKNIAALFALRAVSILTNFLLVPLTLNYLNPTKYGIWLTLTSVLTWVNVLDIGLGTGLRNKFAEAVAKGRDDLARFYVSTSYAFIAMLAGLAILVFWVVNPMLHWAAILNTPPDMEAELSSLARIVFTFFCLRVVFGLIGTILVADQRPAMNSVLEVTANILSLLVIYFLTKSTESSLYWLGFVISSSVLLVPLLANFWYFNRKYKKYLPSVKWVNVKYARELMSLGLQFFFLQMAGIVIFSTSNIIITQFFGPAEVTPFNIAFKYYGVASMAFLMVLTPFWTAYTDAYVKKEREWIERTNRKLKNAWFAMAAGVALMTVCADRVYALWVGDQIHVPFSLSVAMACYVLIIAWSNIFAYFINSTGKLRLQLWAAVIEALLNIALAILLAKNLGLRSTGVTLATCLALLPACFVWPIQMKKLLAGTEDSIWTK
jgi:O-antigen/teichoic acid export membrane protein